MLISSLVSVCQRVAKHALCFFSPAAPANAQIVHSGAACNVNDDNISERIYTIKEGDTLVLQCIVKGHPRPQVSSQSDPFPLIGVESSLTQPAGRLAVVVLTNTLKCTFCSTWTPT